MTLKKLKLSIIILALTLVTSHLKAEVFAQTYYTDPDSFSNTLDDSINSPIVYSLSPSLATSGESTQYTDIACIFDLQCSVIIGSNSTCQSNPTGNPERVCTLPSGRVEINLSIQSTDYNPYLDQFPTTEKKLQNNHDRSFGFIEGKGNALNHPSMRLLLSTKQLLTLQREAARAAKITKQTYDSTGQFPINGYPFDRDLGSIKFHELYDLLPKYIRDEDPGWTTRAVKDNNEYVTILRKLDPTPYDAQEWSYVKSDLCANFAILGEVCATDIATYQEYSRGDLYAALENLRIRTPSNVIKREMSKLESEFPLVKLINNRDYTTLADQNGNLEDNITNFLTTNPSRKSSPGFLPEADATQPPQSESVIEILIERAAEILGFTNTFTAFSSPSRQAVTKVNAMLVSQVHTSDTLNASDIFDNLAKTTLTSLPSLGIPSSDGPGIVRLTDSFSTFMASGADQYCPPNTPIKDYLEGRCSFSSTPLNITATECKGEIIEDLLEGSPYGTPTSTAQNIFSSMIGNISQDLISVYATAEEQTGVPCEVLAGIHMIEATSSFSNPGLDPMNYSLISGRAIGAPEPDTGGQIFGNVLETAIYAGNLLKKKVGGSIDSYQDLITALSRYNGGGNSNCQLGYPYSIPYSGCPRLFEGEDDPYAMAMADEKHSQMYLLYCADHTACEPQPFNRPGSFTFTLLFNEAKSK